MPGNGSLPGLFLQTLSWFWDLRSGCEKLGAPVCPGKLSGYIWVFGIRVGVSVRDGHQIQGRRNPESLLRRLLISLNITLSPPRTGNSS